MIAHSEPCNTERTVLYTELSMRQGYHEGRSIRLRAIYIVDSLKGLLCEESETLCSDLQILL